MDSIRDELLKLWEREGLKRLVGDIVECAVEEVSRMLKLLPVKRMYAAYGGRKQLVAQVGH